MAGVLPIAATGATPTDLLAQRLLQLDALAQSNPAAAQAAAPAAPGSFAVLLADGLSAVEAKVGRADELLKAFAMGESVPLHQVTLALEEARVSVELATQVRSRLLETYRDLMNMQL